MTIEEMTATLDKLGIEVISSRGDEIQAHCPAHQERTGKQDRNPSWWINSDSGAHNCFSCGWKGGLYSLISYVTGTEYDKASEWFDSVDSLKARYARIVKEERPKIEEPTYITESMLSAFIEPPDYALSARGLSSSVINTYGIKWDERNRNWIIPIRDPKSDKLMGWQEKGFDHRYFNNKPSGIKKSDTLFGYTELVTNWAVVVESPLDVARLASLGFPGVAIYGATISKAQLNIIRGLDRVIFALDNDSAGKSSTLALLDMCEGMHMEAWFFNYGDIDVKDVGAMSLDEIRYGINNAHHMLKGKKVIG